LFIAKATIKAVLWIFDLDHQKMVSCR